MSLTDRSSAAMNSRMCRRRGSAMALNGSDVVDGARHEPVIYSHMGICQARMFGALEQIPSLRRAGR